MILWQMTANIVTTISMFGKKSSLIFTHSATLTGRDGRNREMQIDQAN